MGYNCKVLKYKDSTHITFYNCPIKRTPKEEGDTVTDVIKKKIPIIEDLQKDLYKIKNDKHTMKVSVNRSKNNLYRIARSNEWDYFITFTFDPKKVDSTDYDLVSGIVSGWFSNLRKTSPNLKYLAVPELHKDKKKYHYHALISNADSLILSDSGKVDFEGMPIYNIDKWKWGYTTASKIKDNAKVTNYIGKYITKDLMNRLKYKKRYYASKNCNVADEEYMNIYPEELVDLLCEADYIKTVHVPEANQTIKYIEINH